MAYTFLNSQPIFSLLILSYEYSSPHKATIKTTVGAYYKQNTAKWEIVLNTNVALGNQIIIRSQNGAVDVR